MVTTLTMGATNRVEAWLPAKGCAAGGGSQPKFRSVANELTLWTSYDPLTITREIQEYLKAILTPRPPSHVHGMHWARLFNDRMDGRRGKLDEGS